MDGVHPRRRVLLLNGGGVCCCPAAVQWCAPRLTHPTAVLLSTAIVSCIVPCRVCGAVWVSVRLWCLCGGVSSDDPPPFVVVGGAIMVGGVA